jgi:hypothetical protein
MKRLWLLLLASAAHAQPSPAPEVPPAEAPAPRAPLGTPRVMAVERVSGGPVIQIPPDFDPSGQPQAPAQPAAQRTSVFSTLREKAAAIINRTVIGGYGEFAFTKRDGEDSFFEARRFVAFLYSPIWENRISLTAELEFEHGGSPLKSDGQFLPGEAQMEFATIDIRFVDQLVLRGGIVLVPFGRFNINHDAPTQDLTDRPLTLTYIIPSTWFEAGFGLYGRQKLGRGVELNYEAVLINGFDSAITDGDGFRAARGSKLQDNNDDKAFAGRVGLYYFGPIGKKTMQLDLGLSGYTGEYDRRSHRANLVGVDFGLRIAAFELVGEFVRALNEPGYNDDYPLSLRTPVPTDMYGFFIEAHYHLMPQGLRRVLPSWLRESVFTLILRYDLCDTDMSVHSIGDRQRMTFGINYRFIEAVAWKNELQLDHNGPHNPFDNPKLGYVTSIAFLF